MVFKNLGIFWGLLVKKLQLLMSFIFLQKVE